MTTALRSTFLGASLLALPLAAACGGNVVVDHERGGTTVTTTATVTGAGGGSSTSTTVTTTSTSTSTTVTTTTTSTTVPADLCASMCKVLVDSGCQSSGQGQCEQDCNKSLTDAGKCSPQLVAVYQCYEPYLSQCPKDPPPPCSGVLDAYTQCVQQGGGCGSAQCTAGGGPDGEQCDCQQTCNGRFVESTCKSNGGTTVCSCAINGSQGGTCSGSSSKDPCNLKNGCCASFY